MVAGNAVIAVDLTNDAPRPSAPAAPTGSGLADAEGQQGAGPEQGDIDEANQCCICSEPWDSSGPRRVVALKCGHMFCCQCIEQWFNNRKHGTSSMCPICRKKAKARDIVRLVVHGLPLAGPDAAKVQNLQTENAQLQAELKRLREACEGHVIKSAALSSKVRKLEDDLDRQKRSATVRPTQPQQQTDPVDHRVEQLSAAIANATRLVVPGLVYKEASAIAQHGDQGLLFLGAKLPYHPEKAVLVKQSLHYLESRNEIGLTGCRCWDIAAAPPCAGVSSNLLATACGSGIAIVQAADEQIVAYVSAPEANSNCRAVAWRSEHQFWASQKAAVKLFDMRNLTQAVATYNTDDTLVHSLSAVREGVVAGTLRGSYVMAMPPDGCVASLTVRGTPRENGGQCVSVCTASAADAVQTDVITSFRRPGGPEAVPAGEHHSFGALVHGAGAVPWRWSVGRQVRGFESKLTQARSAATHVRLGDSSMLAMCCGDEATGAVRIWAAQHGASPSVCVAGDLHDSVDEPGTMHVRDIAVSALSDGGMMVAALRTRPLSCEDGSLTVYRLPTA